MAIDPESRLHPPHPYKCPPLQQSLHDAKHMKSDEPHENDPGFKIHVVHGSVKGLVSVILHTWSLPVSHLQRHDNVIV